MFLHRCNSVRIILLLADGVPITAIAATVGISRHFIYKWARRFLEQGLAGLADQPSRGRRRGPGKSKLDRYQTEIEGLLANGATQRFIAKRYGTTEGNLHHWMQKRGLKRHRFNPSLTVDGTWE